MINPFIKKIEAILKDLPLRTEISISFTNANVTTFVGLKKEESGIKYIDNKTTAFEIGSVTKAFTGNVLANLATDRKIKLNDLIESFLPFKLLGNPPITFKHLALHTSGLPRMPLGYDDRVDFIKENPFSNYSEGDFVNYLTKNLAMESSPGEKANYSNLGFGLLSYIISLVENKEFSQIVAERIFQPLNMKNTSFNVKNIPTQIKTGLDKEGNPTSFWDGGIFNGSLGIISTADDLSKFSEMMLNCEDESISMQIENTFPAKLEVMTCMGWLMVNFDRQEPIIKLNGGTAGSSSSIFINQKRQKAFTFCSNIHPDSYMELLEHLFVESVM